MITFCSRGECGPPLKGQHTIAAADKFCARLTSGECYTIQQVSTATSVAYIHARAYAIIYSVEARKVFRVWLILSLALLVGHMYTAVAL